MPKAFSDDERAHIGDRLMREGLARFSRHGVRAMRIDDLCRDVGIAKGSFYAFFLSKEALFFALADAHDARHKAEMMDEMRRATGDPRAILGSFFDMVLNRVETDPLMQIVRDRAELAYVMRHAPADYFAENQRRDREFVAEIAELFGTCHGMVHADAPLLEGVMTVMVSLHMQSDYLVATDAYAPTLALLRDMFVRRAMEGPMND